MVKGCVLAVTAGFIFLTSSGLAWGDSTKDEVVELQKQVESLKQGQEAIRKDLAEIKRLLKEAPRRATGNADQRAFTPREIALGDAAVLGRQDAAVTLIAYSDYQCPYCARHYTQTMPEIIKKYIDTGKVRYAMREFPLETIHPRAPAASMAAICAGEQNAYWEMHRLLLGNRNALTDEHLKKYAAQLSMDMVDFDSCLVADRTSNRLQADLNEGRQMGVRGTPSFALGMADPDDPNKVTVTKLLRGMMSHLIFAKEIDDYINANNPKPE